jgi:RNA polymerase sigma-70 factor (ECF subfamily)
MMSPRYEGLFQDWEIGVAKKVIERFRKQWKCLELEGFDDLLQECLTDWHFSKDDYNPSAGANVRTFMSRVVEHKLQHLIEKSTAGKRKAGIDNVSLDQPISDDEGAPTYLDRLSEDEGHTSNLHISAELKIDISRTIEKLTPQQRELCRLLSEEGLSIKEASEVLNKPRGTLYEDIKRIKAIFQKANLNEYLD